MPITKDMRIKFDEAQAVRLRPKGAMIAATDVTGGVIVRLQVEVYDKNDTLLLGVGSGEMGAPITSEHGGKASWLFEPPPTTHYIKWGITAFRSAANLGRYSVTTKVFDFDGTELAISRFEGEIPDKKFNDVLIKDGVRVQMLENPPALGEGMAIQ